MNTEKFEVHGLSFPGSFTFRNQNGCWWAKSGLEAGRFDALFKWAKSDDTFWSSQSIIAEVEFKSKAEDGTPIRGVVKKIETTGKMPEKY